MKTRAAVAFEAGKPLEVCEVDLEGPKEGEVLVEIKATGLCHTDEFTRSGADPEGIFPAILGHEGAGVVVDVGPGVKSLKKGDHVIPLYTPECRECDYCTSGKTNLCQSIRVTQGQGLMPDGTSRFSIKGEKAFHYMGTSTFANHTVVPEIALAKVREDAPFESICYIGCGVTTGIGAVINTAKVQPGDNVVVFGLGGIGLNVIQGARLAGANMIVGVDLNNERKAWGEKFGMTHFVNPTEVEGDLVPYIVDFPPVSTVRYYFYRFRDDGTFVVINELLSVACRVVSDREPEPTAAIIDSQSVKTTESGGISGYDAGKKVKGRKRHISVDTQGNLLAAEVHAASLQDRDKAKDVIASAIDSFPTVSHFFADGGYAGDKVACDLLNMEPSPTIEIVRRPNEAVGFVVIARRWVVERTFAWLGRCRRLAKDWEETIPSSESWLLVASIRRATRYIAKVAKSCKQF